MTKAISISVLIHLIVFLVFWRIVINSSVPIQKEKLFQVSMVTANEYNRMMVESGYAPINKEIDLPESKISEEDIIRQDEMESTKLTDKKYEIIPKNILEPKKTNVVLPGIGKELTTISGNDISDNKFYKLSGIVTTRRVMVKYFPTYPKGYHVNTDVVLGISVNSRGDITDVNIIKRGGVPFDEISVNAARKWKFEPLPSSGIQKGTLTFFYRLK
ncbi:MAG: TonB family protein [Proteobacteria bacterium]|nr:TonB family protein [Pseudomonadota bacterium]